jgi:hypothetical protein
MRQQHADRAVGAVALVGDRVANGRGGTSQRGEDLGELLHQLGIPRRVQVELLGGDVGVQRVRPNAEWQVALELRRGSRQDQAASLLGTAAQLGKQARLADAGLALHRHAGQRPRRHRLERRFELPELRFAPDRPPGADLDGHGANERTPVQGRRFRDRPR